MHMKKLTNIQKDVLKEIGNIGAGNATTALAKLINKKVLMEVPSVEVVAMHEIVDVIGGPEETIVAVFFKIEGEVPGTVYLVISLKEAEQLIQEILTDENVSLIDDEKPDEMAVSAISEAGNIIVGSYISALSDLSVVKMTTTIPYLSIDMAAATLVSGLLELTDVSDEAIVIDTKIKDANNNAVNSHVLLIPDPPTVPVLLNKLGVGANE